MQDLTAVCPKAVWDKYTTEQLKLAKYDKHLSEILCGLSSFHLAKKNVDNKTTLSLFNSRRLDLSTYKAGASARSFVRFGEQMESYDSNPTAASVRSLVGSSQLCLFYFVIVVMVQHE